MKKLLSALLFFGSLSFSQETGFSLYGGPLLFKPLVANTVEPRVGLIWHADDNRLRLDIGNSVDLVHYQFSQPARQLTIGSDFFTYTMLRGEPDFHFPVDAVDYLFGFNVNYRDTLEGGILSGRLRLSHISAHFVDGHFDGTTGVWKDGLAPRVYSREFFDLALAFEPGSVFRGYIGGVYLWHVDPANLPKLSLYAGGELHREVLRSVNLYGAYQYTVSGLRPRHELQIGTKIGSWNGRGTELFFTYYAGNSIHGEYHDRNDDYTGIGFTIDF